MKDNYFIQVVEQVPASQLNDWILQHGFKKIPLNDKRVTKQIVAGVLKAIVDQHGQSSAFELEELRTKANGTKSALAELANPEKPSEVKSGCSCSGNCPCKDKDKKLNGDGATSQNSDLVAQRAEFNFGKFVTDNSKLLITGTLVIIGLAIWKAGSHKPSSH